DLLDADGDRVPFTLSPSGIAALEAAVNELGDVLAVVIDPISAFVPEQIDDHKDSHVRRMLRPLAELAERTGVAIVLVRHLNKSDSGNAGNLVSGSRAYVNASRAAFVVGPDPAFGEEGDRRVLCFCKRNLTKRSRGLAYRGASLTREGQDAVLASPQAADLSAGEKELLRDQLFRVEWLGETDVTASDLARSRRGKDDGGRAGGKAERVEEAAAWLTELLKGGATMESDEVKSRAKAAGIGRNVLFEAKDHAGVRASNRGEFAGKWHWWLPPVTTKPVGEEGDHGADTPF
ncbi:MAG: AAA family ATPase, partial [Gemmataceae bacterium]